MDMSNLQLWLAFQILLEGILLALILIFFMRLRHIRNAKFQSPEHLETSINQFINESEKLSAHFSENLKEKKELSLSLLLKLERKINEMNQLLEKAEEQLSQTAQTQLSAMPSDQNNPAAPESRALVLKLAAKGHSIEEIARTARLHRGEVELILDLEKQFNI
ncbi:MAG: hypothetical protein JRI34_00590 [Deltaproteobacteria bacterium]|nr:hypothetical protein [Deltaproteobacteria bacterium]